MTRHRLLFILHMNRTFNGRGHANRTILVSHFLTRHGLGTTWHQVGAQSGVRLPSALQRLQYWLTLELCTEELNVGLPPTNDNAKC